MPPLGLSTGIGKAGEAARRAASLLLATPRMVEPRAHYAPRPHDSILVLQRGENASTDYYLRDRLKAQPMPGRIVDIDSPPHDCDLLGPAGGQALMVVICRYASGAWLGALEAMPERLARVAFFMDDDLPLMMRDPALSAATRGKVAAHYGAYARRLGALAGEVWVSTPVLARRYADLSPRLLAPMPEADPPEPTAQAGRKVVYHGADVHGAERRFVMAVARRLAETGVDAEVEIVGDAALERSRGGLANVSIVPQLPWPGYLERARRQPAAISLAPLAASALNVARSPIKAFDAARLGAAGLFADMAPYSEFVHDGEDGLLLPMDVQAWADAIADLLARPARRLALAKAARSRLVELRRRDLAFPAGAA